MKRNSRWTVALGVAGGLALAGSAMADVTITTFDDFWSDALYASWAAPETVIEPGATNYVITATGYGSNYKYLGPIDGSGHTTIELTVTLSGPPAADGHLGPIVSLVDGDGTYVNYAWYGQLLGPHVLKMAVATPTWVSAPGSVPGFDLATVTHMHMQLDPGGFGTAGAYTISWENLSFTGVVAPVITAQTYIPSTHEFTLTWSSLEGKSYTILQSDTVNGLYGPLATDIPSGGTATTYTVTMPTGDAGFLRVQQQ